MAIGWYVDPVTAGTTSQAVSRCEWVVQQVKQHDHGKSASKLREQYAAESSDVNSFYRGTAYLFWQDFVKGGWGVSDLSTLGVPTTQADGTPLQRTSTWTWITGDQHLSNFGAWKNRHGDVIFGVNDFDEATIFDFQIDVRHPAHPTPRRAAPRRAAPRRARPAHTGGGCPARSTG